MIGYVTNNETVTYFTDKVEVNIVTGDTIRWYINRMTNITITCDLHIEENNRSTVHYQVGLQYTVCVLKFQPHHAIKESYFALGCFK